MSGRRKDSGGGHGSGEEAWLLPYADMITLLLGLFIVLFALSSIDAKKFDSVSKAFSQTFRGSLLESPGSITEGSGGVLDASQTSANTQLAIQTAQSVAAGQTQQRFDQEREKLREMAKEMQGSSLGKLDVREDERGLVLSVAGDALFDSGSHQLKPAAREKLAEIARHLKVFGAELDIEGHTDGQAFRGEFGNMGLSTLRALSVWKLFVEVGVPATKMETSGRGAEEPIVRPTRPDQAIAKNRRVEIHILAPGKSASSAFVPSQTRARRAAAAQHPERTPLGESVRDEATRSPVQPASAKPTAPEPQAWGGTSKPAGGDAAGDIVDPIVNAS